MKILLVGGDQVYAIERFYKEHFIELGVEVELYPIQNEFYKYYYASSIHRISYQLGLSSIYNKLGLEFLQKVNTFLPDAIWVFKGMELSPQILAEVKKREIKLINYNPDNPFVFSGAGSGNTNVTRSIPLFDLHFTYNREIERKLNSMYDVRTSYLPFGYELSEENYLQLQTIPKIEKGCFLGNPDTQRAELLVELLNQNISIDVFGQSWKRFIHHPNLTVNEPVIGEAFWKTLASYRVQLNLLRKHNLNSHNMRTFEIPGAGSIQLAPDTEEHRAFFNAGREIFLFDNMRDCAGQLNELLKISNSEARDLATTGHLRCILSGYRYQDRARFALQEIQSLF